MRILLSICMLFACTLAHAQPKAKDTALLQPVEVSTVKASDKNPFAKTNITKEQIKKLNIGQDLPFILNQTPSVVVNSDAGNGIGYTGIRIRGSDAARVNVTLNGIPYNDAESQGTYFVDMPDIASSASSIQIQRGVGTSANGAGSFGGSINLSTNEIVRNKNFELNSTVGSYGSFKNTMIFNSGIFNKHFLVDARLSNIRSDGYIERASSRLKSFYVSGAYVTDKSSLRLNIFSGKEKTYQAYYGVDEITLDTNRRYNSAGTEKLGAPYENQTDNYTQTHYQLFYNHRINQYLKTNISAFVSTGKGYYEQYKANQKLKNYGLPAYGSTTKTDMVRQLWLDNNFYGSIFSVQYDKGKTQLIVGGGVNRYEGKHYGLLTWAQIQAAVPQNYKYYDLHAKKSDVSMYSKWTQKVLKNVETFVDLQVRNVHYNINGFKNSPSIIAANSYTFFNPKAGITYNNNKIKLYASYARAAKEPNRDDFEAAANQQPLAEKLNDIETGVEYKLKNAFVGANIYYMFYKDQLILNGKINDVGASTRINVNKSYRAGLELFGNVKINSVISVAGNVTLSKNKVKNYTEYIFNYDNNTQIPTTYNNTDIAYSPNTTASFSVNIVPIENAIISLTSKYVGKQYLDNTSDSKKQLKDFFTQDVRLGYTVLGKKITAVDFYVQANNIFSRLYTPNGYTFSYIAGGQSITENYYFPMAPANFMFGVNVKLW
jgi:iron complex outermembrane recepter protein